MYGFLIYGASRISLRSFRAGGLYGVSISGAGTYDFGTSASPGNNTFNPSAREGAGLNISYDGLAVQSAGNTWVPNEQGADANGKMPANTLWGPVGGKNVSISTAGSNVSF